MKLLAALKKTFPFFTKKKKKNTDIAKIMEKLPLAHIFGPPPKQSRVIVFIDSNHLWRIPGLLSDHPEMRLEFLLLTDVAGNMPDPFFSIADPVHGTRSIPLISPEELGHHPELERVLFAPSHAYAGEGARRLAQAGLVHVLGFPETVAPHHPYYYATWSGQLKELAWRLADMPSKIVLAGRVKALCSGNPGYHRLSSYPLFFHPRVPLGTTDLRLDNGGGELEILMASETTLRERKPNLAIALHHDPNALMTVPEYLFRLNLGYAFYLGHHSLTDHGTYLYAGVRP